MLRWLAVIVLVACVNANGGEAFDRQGIVARPQRPVLSGPELLYRLAQFVDWPVAERSGFLFCIAGEDPEYIAWTSFLASREIGGVRVSIRRLAAPFGQSRQCHVLLLGRSLRGLAARIVAAWRDIPVLTVASFAGFTSVGGMVELPRARQGKLVTLNVEAARRAGLSLQTGILTIAAVEAIASK